MARDRITSCRPGGHPGSVADCQCCRSCASARGFKSTTSRLPPVCTKTRHGWRGEKGCTHMRGLPSFAWVGDVRQSYPFTRLPAYPFTRLPAYGRILSYVANVTPVVFPVLSARM